MPGYTMHDIRNIAVVGHAGSGKTMLIESLLSKAGVIAGKGTIERGDTVCDTDPHEKALGHSLDSSLVYFERNGKHINLLDTPGYQDFLGRTLATLAGVETAAVVINAQTGIEPQTHTMMKAAAKNELCRVIIINQIDGEEVDLEILLEEIQDTFGRECLPLNLPSASGKEVIDCFFNPSTEDTLFSSVQKAHDAMVDQVVEVDEELMEVYLEQGQELNPDQLHDPFEKALREGHLIPVCFTSASTDAGVDELLEIMVRLMPDPSEGNPPHFLKGEGEGAVPVETSPDASAHVVAHVFKISNDPFRGRLGIFRIYQGTVAPDSQLFIGNARKPFKVMHLLRLQGSEHLEMRKAIPGDICAVTRVEELQRDDVLHDSHDEDHYHLVTTEYPVPLYGLALVPRKRGDEQKLSEALHKLQAEDPCLSVEHDAQANETVIRGLGDQHLKVVLHQLENRYNVHVDTRPPSIPYRETITGSAEGSHRHKKQTGGAGQFGEVFLRVEPLPRGEGFQFKDEVKGGVIPGQFIPAVEKGVRQAMDEGFVAGYAMQDIKVTVYDGKHHPVDSKEIAFATAGKKAFLEALAKARSVVLEPIVEMRVVVHGDNLGDVSVDISGRRSRITNTEALSGGRMALSSLTPLAELTDYATKLQAMTAGQGSYTVSFSHYEQVPVNVQEELKSQQKAGHTAD